MHERRNSSARRTRHGAKAQHPPHGSGARGVEQMRQRICVEAARILAEEGVKDFHAAKRKAANRLNQPETRHLPSNQEIEAALAAHLQLFHSDRLPNALKELRATALEAMHFLATFEPRLVGSVLSGTVTPYSEIQLHVSADTPEEVAFLLQEHGIPYDESSRRMRFGGERYKVQPTYHFLADGTAVELTVFTPEGAREAPLSPVDGKPMRRANLREVETLLANGQV